MNAWNIKQLKDTMNADLQACNSAFERSMVKTICGKEIRETAENIVALRKLTPGEYAIAFEFGFRA